jgi:hypothetical protein
MLLRIIIITGDDSLKETSEGTPSDLNVQSSIQQLKAKILEANNRTESYRRTLFMVASQSPTTKVRHLLRQKKTSANVKTTLTWTKDKENQLRLEIEKVNLCHVSFDII